MIVIEQLHALDIVLKPTVGEFRNVDSERKLQFFGELLEKSQVPHVVIFAAGCKTQLAQRKSRGWVHCVHNLTECNSIATCFNLWIVCLTEIIDPLQ